MTVIDLFSETTPLPSTALALIVAVPSLSPVSAALRLAVDTRLTLSSPSRISHSTFGKEGLPRGTALTSIVSPTVTVHFDAVRYILPIYVPVTWRMAESFFA